MPNVRAKPKQLPATRIVSAFILVIALILAAHWPVLSAGALSLDDTEFLTNNDLVRSPGWPSARTFLSEVMEP
ncbi:MAG: hypothetical protein GXP29_09060, partial [Planctomycetes bacterium]|nr:hypothetical protein [Planctomycetota bacterium]